MNSNYDSARDSGFHMEEQTYNSHSMNSDEIKERLDQAVDGALRGEEELRKKLIIPSLEARGIDISNVNLDETLMVGPLSDKFKYYRIANSVIIKVSDELDKLYIFDKDTQTWRESFNLMAEYNYGKLRLEEILISDNYPIGKPWKYDSGREL